MSSSRVLTVPAGSLLACGWAVVACEGRWNELTRAAVHLAALPDVGQAVACVGGGVERADEHVVDRGHGEGRYHVQEAFFPPCIARQNHVLLAAFARYRVPMLEKNAIYCIAPVSQISLPLVGYASYDDTQVCCPRSDRSFFLR